MSPAIWLHDFDDYSKLAEWRRICNYRKSYIADWKFESLIVSSSIKLIRTPLSSVESKPGVIRRTSTLVGHKALCSPGMLLEEWECCDDGTRSAAICVFAVGVSAQVGPAGIVSPDGVNTQFSHDFAHDIVLVGPAGIVTKSGANRQLTHGEATLHVATAAAPFPVAQLVSHRGVVGHSGIVRLDGKNVQFTQAQAGNIVMVGPSGIVTKDGSNIQLTDDLHFVQKRDLSGHLVGASGIVTSDGQLIQFEPGVFVASAGPSGVVLSNGKNIQLNLSKINMKVLAAICVFAVGVSAQVGPAGIVSPDGVNTQFSHDFAHDIVLVGPAGIVTKSGANRQLTHGEATLHVATAPAPLPVAQLVSHRGVVGHSGIVRPDGKNVQFTHDQAGNIVLVGPSGIVTKDGSNIQLTDDLHFVQKRDTYGHLVGASGIVTKDGQLIQFEPGVFVASAGPSGVVLSNGKNIQLNL
ncbi:uncharacterized protein LOC119592877 [Penaeus monodon]|uniref:uncharacterized protein LOC119592877 n=1 Tax=Penaeus monodon TaxID=6687 RepID=UPI0018A72D50|nr:uncharacterized protein LOC119592877 [Penaeus monodon]